MYSELVLCLPDWFNVIISLDNTEKSFCHEKLEYLSMPKKNLKYLEVTGQLRDFFQAMLFNLSICRIFLQQQTFITEDKP